MPSIPTVTCTSLVRRERSRMGSHRREETCSHKGYTLTKYVYYSTAICVVNEDTKEFYTDYGGYHTASTTWAIRSYERLLSPRYTQITKEEAKRKWGIF